MAKIQSIIIIGFSVIFISCTKNDDLYEEFVEYFKVNSDQEIKTNLKYGDMLLSAVDYNDSLLFFTEGSTQNIYKYDKKLCTLSILGKKGKNPGEYINPFDLSIAEKNILFSDYDDYTKVEKLSFDGTYTGDCYTIDKKMIWRFAYCNEEIYGLYTFLGKDYPFLVYSSKGKTFFNKPNVFKKFPLSLSSCGIKKYRNNIYFLNGFEFKIYKIDLENVQEAIINLSGMENNYNLEPYYNDKLTEKEYSNIAKNYVEPIGLHLLEHENKIYYIIPGRYKKDIFFYIFNSEGKMIHKIKNIGLLLLTASKDKMVCQRTNYEKGTKSIVEFKIDDKLYHTIKK